MEERPAPPSYNLIPCDSSAPNSAKQLCERQTSGAARRLYLFGGGRLHPCLRGIVHPACAAAASPMIDDLLHMYRNVLHVDLDKHTKRQRNGRAQIDSSNLPKLSFNFIPEVIFWQTISKLNSFSFWQGRRDLSGLLQFKRCTRISFALKFAAFSYAMEVSCLIRRHSEWQTAATGA